jgi:SAM-dependent methyltransferase
MVPSFPSAPAWYRPVLVGRWLLLKAAVAAGRADTTPFTGERLMNQTTSPLTGSAIAERLVAEQGGGYAMADALSRYVWTLPHLDGKRVVDLGCGTGYGAYVVSWVADAVTALDFSPDAIAYAREHYPGPVYDVADLTQVAELPAGDVGLCFEVLEHLPDPDRAMRAAFAAYPRVFFSVPNPWWHNSQLNPHHVNDFPLSEWRRRLSAAGAGSIRLSCQMVGKPQVVRGYRPRASSWVLDCTRA